MSAGSLIFAALAGLGPTVYPGPHEGQESEYYSYNYDLLPVQFSGNRPAWYKALVQVHYFCPLEQNSVQRRRETIEALAEAGFTWPEVVDATEKNVQHFVFECEILTDERTDKNA